LYAGRKRGGALKAVLQPEGGKAAPFLISRRGKMGMSSSWREREREEEKGQEGLTNCAYGPREPGNCVEPQKEKTRKKKEIGGEQNRGNRPGQRKAHVYGPTRERGKREPAEATKKRRELDQAFQSIFAVERTRKGESSRAAIRHQEGKKEERGGKVRWCRPNRGRVTGKKCVRSVPRATRKVSPAVLRSPEKKKKTKSVNLECSGEGKRYHSRPRRIPLLFLIAKKAAFSPLYPRGRRKGAKRSSVLDPKKKQPGTCLTGRGAPLPHRAKKEPDPTMFQIGRRGKKSQEPAFP